MIHDLLHLLFAPSPLKLLALATLGVTLLCRYVLSSLAIIGYHVITPVSAADEQKYMGLKMMIKVDVGRDGLSKMAQDMSALIKKLGWRTRVRVALYYVATDIGISAFLIGALIGVLFYPGPRLVSALLVACYCAVSSSWLYRHIWWLRRSTPVAG